MEWFNELVRYDQKLLIYLNNFSSTWADDSMILISETYPWIPFYAVLLFLIVKQFKFNATWIVLSIVATIALCDQIASSLFKPMVLRLRPCHEPNIEPLLRMITDCGGEYGFFSSHASNSFGLAMFVWLLFRKKSAHWNCIFVWASAVSYSRIYLGKHYPLDIIAGALCGILVGTGMFLLSQYLLKKYPLSVK